MNLHKVIFTLLLASYLMACGSDNSNKLAIKTHQYSERPLVDGVLSSDGSHALLLSIDGVLSLWDNQTHTLIRDWHDFDINENVYFAALSRNKQVAAVAGKTQVSVLNVTNGEILQSWHPKGFDIDATITVLKLGHSDSNIWLGLSDGSIIFIDLQNNKQSMFAHHKGPIADIKLGKNQQTVLSSSTDGSLVYWNVHDGSVNKERDQRYRITSLSIHEASQRVFLSDALKSQLIWDLRSSKIISQLNYFRGARTFRESLFVDNGLILITASSKQKITMWDVTSGEELHQWQASARSLASTVYAMAQLQYGKLHTLSSDGILEIWDIETHTYR